MRAVLDLGLIRRWCGAVEALVGAGDVGEVGAGGGGDLVGGGGEYSVGV
jgi:hypothetical protein